MTPLLLPPTTRLRELFHYDDTTGELFWKTGKRAGRSIGSKGYCHVTIDGRRRQIHRVMWKIVTGEEPAEIDHINKNKHDNRFVNLRSATKSQNQFNAKLRADSSSGVKGVSFLKRERKWRVLITANKNRHQKLFKDFDAACKYAKLLRKQLHGEFSTDE